MFTIQNILYIAWARFAIGNVMFFIHHCVTGLERSSIQSLIFDAVQQSEVDCRRELYRNIFLTGGTPKLPGKHAFQVNMRSR